MAFGDPDTRACFSVFQRLAGEQRGTRLARLSTALIQAILVGLAS
jgi:hypothetical protein